MRKSLLLVALLIVSSVSSMFAQVDLFEGPDTVCVRQLIQLESNVPNKQSHYWGFCSGYLYNSPTGRNLGSSFDLNEPTGIEVAKGDDGNYYAFVINRIDNTLKRLNFGKDLSNENPEVTDFGDMDGIFPIECNSLYLVRDMVDSNWYLFVTSGAALGTSGLSRIDFGKKLSNTPNIVTFGNLEDKFLNPGGLFIAKQGNNWMGFVANSGRNEILRIDMGDNISLTPTVTALTIPPADFSFPTDIAPILDNGQWYFFVTNGTGGGAGGGYIMRVDMGSDLTNMSPSTSIISSTLPDLSFPSSITLVRDCGKILGFVVNRSSNRVTRIEMEGGATGPYEGTNLANPGQTSTPSCISRVIRDRDNVYTFISNQGDASITRVGFEQCTRSSIKFSTTNTPPPYSYDTSGLYNVYYVVNEGMPDMQVQCKLIRALKIPAITLLPEDTTICQGDSANLRVVSINATSFNWSPNYNISSTQKEEIKVAPETSTKYNVRLPYPLGSCVVDTHITVNVVQLQADAGPDREIADGEETLLGGPNTSEDRHMLKVWSPNRYIDDIYAENPVVRPPHDFTYYLTITDTGLNPQCAVIDTVVVKVTCADANLPNAFMPESGGGRSKFGLLNSQIVKLDRFSIYDRWGVRVFSTTDPTNEWDGTIDGEKGAVGVYIWEFDGFCSSGLRVRKTGNVMLIR